MKVPFAMILILVISQASADNLRKSRESKHIHGRRLEVPNDGDMYRLFVHYDEGHDELYNSLSTSSHCTVQYDLDNINEMVVTVDEDGMTEIENNPMVAYYEADVKRFKQAMPDDYNQEEVQRKRELRRLLENSEEYHAHVRRQLHPTKNATVTFAMLERRRLKEQRKLAQEDVYGVNMVEAREVWDETNRGQGVKVCVIDTGIDREHVDLDRNKLTGFTERASLPWYQDGDGHGTHCSGTIAAVDDNKGSVGVAPLASIHTIRVFDNNANFVWASDLAEAGRKCEEGGAKVISMSLGGPGSTNAERNYYEGLRNRGVVAIAAAGNSGNSNIEYPGSYEGVVSVAAVNSAGNRASFSQFNQFVEIAAPGVDVYSTIPNDRYDYFSGTSMATPHVAGVAALLFGKYPGASADQIREALQQGAVDRGSNGRDNYYGYGIVNALNSIRVLDANAGPTPPPQPTPSPAPVETPLPTPGPAPAPTPPPTLPENCNGLFVEMIVRTDGFGDEVAAELRDENGNIVFSEANYPSYVLTTDTACVASNLCWTYEVSDSWGDGLFDDGYITLNVDGQEELYRTGDYGDGFSHNFGNCGGGGGGGDGGDGGGGGNGGCASGEDSVVVFLQTDSFGYETTIDLKRGNSLIERHNGFASNTAYQIEMCIPAGQCNKVVVRDSAWDGLCCAWGNGYADVKLNGNFVGRAAQFGNKKTIQVNC